MAGEDKKWARAALSKFGSKSASCKRKHIVDKG
jgi:hypothetical protein